MEKVLQVSLCVCVEKVLQAVSKDSMEMKRKIQELEENKRKEDSNLSPPHSGGDSPLNMVHHTQILNHKHRVSLISRFHHCRNMQCILLLFKIRISLYGIFF
eukprot:GHVR01141311.1.p1 GENE.GHVR01141311.1~~GHVR01141311.1.p1  ORF type:complete len:102 (+),score=12.92 GHVR01141311.1:153-458(+)